MPDRENSTARKPDGKVVALRAATIPLVRYDAMCSAIAACHDIDEVLQHRATAAVMAEAYARIANDPAQARKCEEIRRRAERQAGAFLARVEKAKRGPDHATGQRSQQNTPVKTLADMGISRQQASDWQRLAKVPAPAFEEAINNPAGPVPSAREIAAQHELEKRPRRRSVVDQVDPKAMWLWGRLLEFESEGILDLDQNTLLETMLAHQRETTHDLAPRVAAWLGRIKR